MVEVHKEAFGMAGVKVSILKRHRRDVAYLVLNPALDAGLTRSLVCRRDHLLPDVEANHTACGADDLG
jgi:hypothetical protein